MSHAPHNAQSAHHLQCVQPALINIMLMIMENVKHAWKGVLHVVMEILVQLMKVEKSLSMEN